jgi:hypothetical protein
MRTGPLLLMTVLLHFLALLTGCAGGVFRGERAAGAVEPQAEELLRRMAGHLQRQPRLRFTAEQYTERTGPAGPTSTRRAMQVELARPNRLRVLATGPDGRRIVLSDGRELQYFDEAGGGSRSWPAEPTVDRTLDLLKKRSGFELPLDELLRSRPYEALTRTVESVEFLGTEALEGVACERLGFTRGEREWEIWILAGAAPWPRRLVLNEPGRRQSAYTVVDFRDWEALPASADLDEFPIRMADDDLRPARRSAADRASDRASARAAQRQSEAERDRRKEAEKARKKQLEAQREQAEKARKEQERQRKARERDRSERAELERLNRRAATLDEWPEDDEDDFRR